MKIGVFDHFDGDGGPLAAQYEWRLKLIEAYDRSGIDIYHLAEHHSTPLGLAPSPSVFLSAVAQRTKRLRFGPMVYTLSLHHPLRVMEEMCMLDQMSDGRVELGVSRGISPLESTFYGVDPKQSRDIYVEVLEILLKAFRRNRWITRANSIASQERRSPSRRCNCRIRRCGMARSVPRRRLAGAACDEYRHQRADAGGPRDHRPLSRAVANARPRPGEAAVAWHEPPYRHRRDRCRRAGRRAPQLCALARKLHLSMAAQQHGADLGRLSRHRRSLDGDRHELRRLARDGLRQVARRDRDDGRQLPAVALCLWRHDLAEALRSVELFARDVRPALARLFDGFFGDRASNSR